MRISKSAHLKRLLQTQDVLLSGLTYVVTVDALWLAGESLERTLVHLELTPVVLALGIIASITNEPKLHGEHIGRLILFAVRYTAWVLMGLVTVGYFSGFHQFSGPLLGLHAAFLLSTLLANRALLRWWYFRGRQEHPDNYLKVLVIGNGPRARTLMDTYRENSEWGVHIIGVLDPRVGSPEANGHGVATFNDAPLLGNLGHIREILATTVVDEVIVCLPRSLLNDLGEVVAACQEEAVCIKFLADIYDLDTGTVRLDAIGAMPVLSFEPVPHEEGMLVAKRIVDLMIALPFTLLLVPLFAVVAVAIKLDSRGPVFFVQPRVGLNKRTFNMVKFRSMFADAEQRMAEIEHLNEADGPIFKMANDPRVTRVGRFLRRTSIDELPQLLNVLRGQMSLVGPRPMSLRDVNQFSLGIQRRRFSVRPGLACLREVSGRSRLSFERWLELDLQYIEEWSLWLDIKILFKLIPTVLKGDGAT
jgi:exopolysaccharide biosynthesis polyprenyl glycosylphosphotransferase